MTTFLISEYFSDDMKRTAAVYRRGNSYKVSVKDEMGSTFVSEFEKIDDANDYAEDFALKQGQFKE